MLEKVKDILVEYVDIVREEITLEKSLGYDLGISSLDMVNIVIAFEEEFGVEIPDRKLGEITTVEDVVRILEEI